LSREQHEVARFAAADGLQVEWHPRLATPTRVRGQVLGERRAFSGGKGLIAREGGEIQHDAIAVLDNLSRFYRLQDAEKEFALKRIDPDALGFHHVRLRQVDHGRPVFGGEVTVHFNSAGQPYQVSGHYVPDVPAGLVSKIGADEAVHRAQQDLKDASRRNGILAEPPAEVIFALQSEPRLAYAVTLVSRELVFGRGRWRYWIDAQDGTVLLRFDESEAIAPPTSHGTNVLLRGRILAGEGGQATALTGWREDTGFHYLHNEDRRWFVYNVASEGWPDAGTYAYRVTNDWGDSDPVEMSLARNFDAVQRYFRDVHGRSSFDGSNAFVRVNAHAGVNLVDAYWDADREQFFFGDGDGVEAESLAVLDICAHEYTHALNGHSAGLVFVNESGALSESFADILGACVEFHVQPDGRGFYPDKAAGTADWLAGEDAWRSTVALRDLRNPHNPATVGAGNEQPSRYRGTFWYDGPGDNGGVHFNSGVHNFFFYLLSEGGSGDNDGIPYQVSGLGISNAARLAYRALTVYCTPHTEYHAVRGAWISAALDLDTNWVASVSAAWTAVGVGALHVVPGGAVTFRGPAGGPFDPPAPSFGLFNRGTEPLAWTATSSEAWLRADPDRGTILPGGSNLIRLSVEPVAAAALGPGHHTNVISFSNSVEAAIHRRPVNLLVGQPDYFAEIFEEADNDLEFQTWTFTPDGSAGYYAVCREAATRFPTDPAEGESLFLTDDSFATILLAGTHTVSLYGRRTNIFFVGSNGYITFGSPDFSYHETVAGHFARPRVAGCFDDLNPASGGEVSWRQTSDRVAVTFCNVREHGSSATVSFQIELYFDGTIRLTCLAIGVTDGLTGLSAGMGVPAGFVESDFAAYRSCPRPQPHLEAGIEGTNRFVSWSAAFSGGLEWSTNLGPSSAEWMPLSPPPPLLQDQGKYRITLPTTEGTRFYRLRTE
jgi:Zn-dependent metalloprotease